ELDHVRDRESLEPMAGARDQSERPVRGSAIPVIGDHLHRDQRRRAGGLERDPPSQALGADPELTGELTPLHPVLPARAGPACDPIPQRLGVPAPAPSLDARQLSMKLLELSILDRAGRAESARSV